MKTKTQEQLEKEIEEKDKWITENAERLKEGFRKTSTFKKIIDGAIDVMEKKGWEQAELFRSLLEELYLNGCIQGVNGQRIVGLKTQLSQHLTDIKNFEKLIDKIDNMRIWNQNDGLKKVKEALKEL